jgi:hypothetical protein
MKSKKQYFITFSNHEKGLFISVKKEAVVMVSVIVVAAYIAILVAKWNYFAKYNKGHK